VETHRPCPTVHAMNHRHCKRRHLRVPIPLAARRRARAPWQSCDNRRRSLDSLCSWPVDPIGCGFRPGRVRTRANRFGVRLGSRIACWFSFVRAPSQPFDSTESKTAWVGDLGSVTSWSGSQASSARFPTGQGTSMASGALDPSRGRIRPSTVHSLCFSADHFDGGGARQNPAKQLRGPSIATS